MGNALKAFVAFTYAFTVVRQFGAIFAAAQQAASRATSVGEFAAMFVRFPATGLERATLDLFCLSVAALLLYVHHYVLTNHIMTQSYRPMYFIADLPTALLFYANAEILAHIDAQRTFGWNRAWLTLMLVYVVMMLRLALVRPSDDSKRIWARALNWYAVGAACATLGWVIGKPRFNALQTLDRVIAVGAVFLVVVWVLEICLRPRARMADRVVSAWSIGIILLAGGSIVRLFAVKPAAQLIVQLRHRVPISAALLLISIVALIVVSRDHGRAWNSLRQDIVAMIRGNDADAPGSSPNS